MSRGWQRESASRVTNENKLFRKQLGVDKTHSSHVKFVTYRNILNQIKRVAKQTYYKELLRQHSQDMRKTWRVMNTIIRRTSDKSALTEKFLVNGNEQTDENIIANGFCEFFANIGEKYANDIGKSRYTFLNIWTHQVQLVPSFFAQPIL